MNRIDSKTLAQRAARAAEQLGDCDLCAAECHCDRTRGVTGRCGLDARAWWFRECLHYGIEFELCPAHAIYLTGCNLRCAYCNVLNWVRQPRGGHAWDAEWLAERVAARRGEGARTLMFVGGEPTVSLPAILDLLARINPLPRVVWDSNLLLSAASRDLLAGVVDTFIADYKFGNPVCAWRLGGRELYLEQLQKNLLLAAGSAGLIVRHVILPGHSECCVGPMMTWLARYLPGVRLSLQSGYMPAQGAQPGRAQELGRGLAAAEVARAQVLACDAGVELVQG